MAIQTNRDRLATFASADDLYRSRGEDVNPFRPVFTGDVFENIPIAGVQASGMGMLISQPCTMRQGPRLRDRMLAIPVMEREPVPPERWSEGYFKEHPVPELLDASTYYAARFPLVGLIDSHDLQMNCRLACLSDTGVDYLQQRLIWNMTRVLVKLRDIRPFTRAYSDEAELLEVWRDRLCGDLLNEEDATNRFDAFLNADGRREKLADADYAAQVRRECERKSIQLEREMSERR